MAPPLAFFNLGFPEILIILGVGLLIFGEKLPQVVRSVGKSWGQLKSELDQAKRSVERELEEAAREADVTAVVKQPPPPNEPVAAPPCAPRSPPAGPLLPFDAAEAKAPPPAETAAIESGPEAESDVPPEDIAARPCAPETTEKSKLNAENEPEQTKSAEGRQES
jgi:TatA/E family protein of Tat protein translocase